MNRWFAFFQRTRYLLLLLLLAGLAMALLAPVFRGESGTRDLPGVLLEAAGPFQKGLTKGTRLLGGIWENYLLTIHAQEENRALREIIEELKQERLLLLEAKAENVRLRGLLGFKQEMPEPLLPAQVIGKDLSAWFHTVVIDRGKQDGIEEGMAVLSVQGVVGQIMESSRNFSRVLLITDPNWAAAGLIQRTRARGIAEGSGLDQCRFKYLQQSEDVTEGDLVLSSGLDGVYPKGSLIGTITRIEGSQGEIFKELTLQPSVEFNKLEEVLVLCRKPVPVPPGAESIPP